MDSNVTLMDEVDTTNTPFDPVIVVTFFVTAAVSGWIVVVFINVVDPFSLTSCVPFINFRMNEVPDVYL